MASSAADLITGALLNLNAYAPAQTLSPQDGTVGLNVLNDLLDSLSNDDCFIFTQIESIFTWISGQFEYTVGNPQIGTFTGVLTSGSPAITSVATLPSGLLATNGGQVGSTVSDNTNGGGGVIPYQSLIQPATPFLQTGNNATGNPTTVSQIGVAVVFTGAVGSGSQAATIASVNGVAGGWPYVSGVNNILFSDGEIRAVTFTNGSTGVTWTGGLTNTVQATASAPNLILMSQNATATPATNPDVITYTVPGNIPIDRPLRFRAGFTRASAGGSGNASLDYTFRFVDFDAYKRELLKNVQGPWPYIASYQPTFPYGTLYVYPNPSAGYVAHIFSDYKLARFASVTAAYAMPEGYTRALKKLLALELAPIYGKIVTGELRQQAKEAKELLMGTNESPVKLLEYDTSINRGQATDAGWILHGGFK